MTSRSIDQYPWPNDNADGVPRSTRDDPTSGENLSRQTGQKLLSKDFGMARGGESVLLRIFGQIYLADYKSILKSPALAQQTLHESCNYRRAK
jgi:hypothetical protein